MKSICVLCDARGNLRPILTRSGDLVRRELSTPSAPVHLVWMSIAPSGVSPRRIVEHLEASVLPRHTDKVSRDRIPISFYRDMILAAYLCPLAAYSWSRLRSRVRRPFARAWHRVFGGAS